MIDASIIEKIQKLRAITQQRGATEQEAIAAQQAMFTLLAKHNEVQKGQFAALYCGAVVIRFKD